MYFSKAQATPKVTSYPAFFFFFSLIVNRSQLNDWGFESQYGLGIFLLTTLFRLASGPTQPPVQWVPGVLSLGVRWVGREADHSLPSSAEVKNAWSYTSPPQYASMAWCSVKRKAQEQLYLTWSHSIYMYQECETFNLFKHL
jgi:hypothetical protein